MVMLPAVRTVVVDFDGTIAVPDCTRWLFERFAPHETQRVLDEVRHRGMGSQEFYRRMLGYLPPDVKQLTNLVLDQARLMEGFGAFLDYCRHHGVSVVVASDGLGFYIHPFLKRYGIDSKLQVFCNALVARVGRLEIEFPFRHPMCGLCGTCKRLIVDRYRYFGPVALVGDGVGDIYAAARADLVLAKDELLNECTRAGVTARSWCNFTDVIAALDGAVKIGEVRDLCPLPIVRAENCRKMAETI